MAGIEDQLEDEEATQVTKGRSKKARFNDDDDDEEDADKDTPPTRSRSRKARSRVAFGEPSGGTNLKSALKDAGDGSKSMGNIQFGRVDRSRGSSKSRGRSVGSNNRVFRDPGHGVGG